MPYKGLTATHQTTFENSTLCNRTYALFNVRNFLISQHKNVFDPFTF
jgi:hypothetical protein